MLIMKCKQCHREITGYSKPLDKLTLSALKRVLGYSPEATYLQRGKLFGPSRKPCKQLNGNNVVVFLPASIKQFLSFIFFLF